MPYVIRAPKIMTFLGIAVVLALSACTSSEGGTAPAAETEETATVTVVARDMTSVLVVAGTVVSSPNAIVPAPTSGTVSFLNSALSALTLASGATIGEVGAVGVTMPFAGRLVGTSYPTGAQVVSNAPIASASYVGFGVLAGIPVEQLYRLYSQPTTAIVSITGGPAGTTCALFPSESGVDLPAGSVPVVCMLPADAAVVAGLPAKLGIETASKQGVLAVPVTAVLGSSKQGRVTLIRDGRRIVTAVELGISDGSYIEIVSGLAEGDQILAHAPGLQ